MSELKWFEQDRIISTRLMTNHAMDRIKSRFDGIITINQVIDKINQYRPELSKLTHLDQVLVVIDKLDKVYHINGSHGDIIVACVDPRTITVKTVMLRHSGQLGHKLS